MQIQSIQSVSQYISPTVNVSGDENVIAFSDILSKETEKKPQESSLKKALSLETVYGISPGKGNSISLDELQTNGEKFLKEFNEKIQADFVLYGFDLDHDIQLTVGRSGEILVKNDHPDKAKIEKYFADHPELGNEYRKITNIFSLVANGREASEFQAAYMKNPRAAVVQYAYLFNSDLAADMEIKHGEAEIIYNRVFN